MSGGATGAKDDVVDDASGGATRARDQRTVDAATDRATVRGLVVLEQTLGHVTHGKNLQRLLPAVPDFEPDFALIPFEVSGFPSHVPGFGNWTVRAGLRARRAVRRHRRVATPDVMIVHTQVPAVFLGSAMRRIPTVVSLDATPLQYDALGEHYAHDVGPRAIERAKYELNKRCFGSARRLVTWAEWTKRSLVDDYGVDADRVTVIPPGVDAQRWRRRSPGGRGGDTVRVLFVGGDLRRKGGHLLVAAFERLRRVHGPAIELHLVTPSPVEPAEGVVVHDSMTPNSPALIDLYHRCDIFCLPTLGDCLPMVLPEAGAAGLALVSTDVGAIGEVVRDGETGLLVPVGDVGSLEQALERLIDDGQLRARLADNAESLVMASHDAAKNAARLVDVARDALTEV